MSSPRSFFLLRMNLGQYSGTENPAARRIWSVDEDHTGATKSYTCAFCKRGFSNAQALGGHMNIHRKDRAKLKEAADQDHYHNQTLLSLHISSSDSSSSSRDITTAASLSSSSTSPQDSLGSSNMSNNKQQQLEKSSLDLELRLGPEPRPPPTCM